MLMWNLRGTHLRNDNCWFPFYFQSAPLVSMGIAAARHAHSVCTAVGPATTSQACVTACLASQVPSAMKVRGASVLGEACDDGRTSRSLSSGFPEDTSSVLCSRNLLVRCVCNFYKYDQKLWKAGLLLRQNLFILWAVRLFGFNWKQPPTKD